MSSSRLLLLLSVVCAVISITPLGDEWQVLVRLAPDWTAHPNGYPFEAPHEWLAMAMVDAWQAAVQAAAHRAWLTDAQAAALIADGLPLNGVLQTVAGVSFVLAAFLWAIASVRSPKSVPLEVDAKAAAPVGVEEPVIAAAQPEPVMAAPVAAHGLAEPIAEPAVAPSAVAPVNTLEKRLADLELQVGNLLLNPNAQPVAEELADLSRDLREVSRALKSSDSHQ